MSKPLRIWRKPFNKKLILAAALIGCGITLAVIAGVLFYGQHQGETIPRPNTVQPTAEAAPSSVKPAKQVVDTYDVSPELPKYISIPAINVDTTRVIQLGILKNKQIAAPENIHDAGWYRGTAKPGQSGAMFIYGHVSSPTAHGAFYNLKKLKPGDKVVVTRGDNTKYVYQVSSSKVYPYDNVDMETVLAPVDATKPGLNLMTCAGHVIRGTHEFSERLVVFTSLVTE
jgi:sortase A